MEEKDKSKLILIIVGVFLFLCFCFSTGLAFVYVATNRLTNILPVNQDFDDTRCWNRVRPDTQNKYYWSDGCKGEKGRDICTQVLVELTPKEIVEYKKWESLGKPQISGCGTVKGN